MHRVREILDTACAWIYKRDDYGRNISAKNSCDDRPLFVWQDHGFQRVEIDSIIYLKASRSYCELYLHDHKKMVVSIPMSAVAGYFHQEAFIRIHRSYIINSKYISAFVGNTLIMEGGDKIPISKEYKKAVIARFILIGSKSRKYNL